MDFESKVDSMLGKLFCFFGLHDLWDFSLSPHAKYTTLHGISIESRDEPVEGKFCRNCHHVEIWTNGDAHITDPNDNVISVKYK